LHTRRENLDSSDRGVYSHDLPNQQQANAQTLRDHQVSEHRQGLWQEIGAAWEHRDGDGFNIKLLLLPLVVPGPITGTRRWDRKAIDAALDKRSDLVAASSSSLNPRETADQALHEWLQGAD
jgi:hypothetical protein